MSAKVYAELACDAEDCRRRFHGAGEVGHVRDGAIVFGWTYAHPGRDYCPGHPPAPTLESPA